MVGLLQIQEVRVDLVDDCRSFPNVPIVRMKIMTNPARPTEQSLFVPGDSEGYRQTLTKL